MVEFPALNGQSVSYAVRQYPAGSINSPHIHPRSTELLFLIDGMLEVGIVDMKSVLYIQKLRFGDMFLFQKGLVQFQYNRNHKVPTLVVSSFGSANAGTISVPMSIYRTGIDDEILAKSFKTDVSTIKKLKLGFTNP